MPIFEVQGPDGKTYEADAPTMEAAAAAFGPAKPQPSAFDHLLSTAKNVAGGVWEPTAAILRGAVAKPVSDLAGLGTIATNALTGSNYDPAQTKQNALDTIGYTPQTEGGKAVMGAIGTAAKNTLGKFSGALGNSAAADASLLGADQGTQDVARSGGTELGDQIPALAGLKAPALGASRVAKAADAAVASGPRQAAIQAAKDNGYVLLPSDMASAPVGKFAAGIGGKNDMNSAASIVNQHNTNRLAKVDVGIPQDTPLTGAELAKRDAVANKGYDAVEKADQNMVLARDAQGNILKNASGKMIARPAGPMQEDPAYLADISKLGEESAGSQLPPNPEVAALRNVLSGASGALKPLDAIKDLGRIRTSARANLKAVDSPAKLELGNAQMQAADAMEARIERYLQNTGQTDLYKQFTAARTLKAKLHTIKDNINTATNDVDAAGIAAERERTGGAKSPMSGGLKAIADAADTLQNTVKNTSHVQAPAPFSALGLTAMAASSPIAFGSHAAGAGAAAAGALLSSRPLLRSSLLSDLYQRQLGAQTPTASALSRLAAQPGSPAAGLAIAPQDEQQ